MAKKIYVKRFGQHFEWQLRRMFLSTSKGRIVFFISIDIITSLYYRLNRCVFSSEKGAGLKC